MPRFKRVIIWASISLQGYATLAAISHSFWFFPLPQGLPFYPVVGVMFFIGSTVLHVMLTSEFARKTQLEADQVAAQLIQQSLTPETLENVPGYDVEAFYKPFSQIGGDYFDVIALPGNRTLFAIADVSGKGMAAALLSANIQALVRSIASVEVDPLVFADRINHHLSRYTPLDRYATAVFLVLSAETGELTYVNAGHNAPMVFTSGSTSLLEPTGMPLGMFAGATYVSGTSILPLGGVLLLFTDGLPDSISGDHSDRDLRAVLAGDPARTMVNLKSLVDPEFNEDDVTILVVKRAL